MDQRTPHLMLDGLPQGEVEWLESRLKRVHLKSQQVLVEVGEIPLAVWFLLDATASVCANGPGNRQLGVTVIGKGHTAGAGIVLGPQPAPWTIAVDQSGDALCLTASGAELAINAPSLFERLGWAAHEDLIELSETALAMAHATATQRVAIALDHLFIANEDRLIATTHERLSAWLALRRATVTLALQELEAMKAIKSRRGTVELLDARKLSAIATGAHSGERSVR